MLKGAIQEAMSKHRDWKLEIQKAVWAYRVTTHSTTGLSPIVMMRGRKPRCKFNPCWIFEGKVEHWSPTNVKNNLELVHEKSKEHYDKSHGVKDVPVKVGDWVRVKRPTKVPKGENQFEAPQEVVEVSHDEGQCAKKSLGYDWVEEYFNHSAIQTRLASDGVHDNEPLEFDKVLWKLGRTSTMTPSPQRERVLKVVRWCVQILLNHLGEVRVLVTGGWCVVLCLHS